MTSRAYRARYRGYRNFGLWAWLVTACVAAGAVWVPVLAGVAILPFCVGAVPLLGYYVTGFSEGRE